MSRKILIIGGTRFVGPELIKLLLKNNDEVTIFSRGTDYKKVLDKRINQIVGDRENELDLKQLEKENYEVVYDMCCYNPQQAKKLVPHVKTSHFVFFSTAAVYEKPCIYPLSETGITGEWDSFGDYGVNKMGVELYLSEKSKDVGFKLSIIRPVYILGEDNYFDRENYYFSRLLSEQLILVPGSGQALIQFCFLNDVAKALFSMPYKQKKDIDTINLGSDEYISVIGLVRLCAKVAHKEANIVNLNLRKLGLHEEHFYDDLYPFPNVSLILDNTKAKQDYNICFTPLEPGLARIFLSWQTTWNGKVVQSKQESEIIKKIKGDISDWSI